MNRASFCCCMRADGSDETCEGRQVARLHQAEGGMRCRTDFSELLPAEPVTAPPPVLMRLLIAAVARVVAVALGCYLLLGGR